MVPSLARVHDVTLASNVTALRQNERRKLPESTRSITAGAQLDAHGQEHPDQLSDLLDALFSMTPNSERWPRSEFAPAVRCSMSNCREVCCIRAACCSSVLMRPTLISGREAAS